MNAKLFILMLGAPLFALGANDQAILKLSPPSSELTSIPPPSKAVSAIVTPSSVDADEMLAPPPPSLPRRGEIQLIVAADRAGAFFDFQLPGGQLQSVKWVAKGPDNSDLSAAVDVQVYSPSVFLRPSAAGVLQAFVDPRGGNFRVTVLRKNNSGPIAVGVYIDLLPQ